VVICALVIRLLLCPMHQMCPNINAKTGKQSMLLQFGVSVCTTTQACVFGTKQSLCILSCVHKQGHQVQEKKTLKKLPQVACLMSMQIFM
jgi:Na+/melibiose symporter-like transporter